MAFNQHAAVQWHPEVEEDLDPSAFLLSAQFLRRNRTFIDHDLTSETHFYSRGLHRWRVRTQQHGHPPFCKRDIQNSCKKPMLAVMASAVAILTLIFVCRFGRRKKEHLSILANRKLAEDDRADAPSEPPEMCGDKQNTQEDSNAVPEPFPKKRLRKTSEGESEGSVGGEDTTTAGPSSQTKKRKGKRKHLEVEPPTLHRVQLGDDNNEFHDAQTAALPEWSWDETLVAEAMLLLQHYPLIPITSFQKEETAHQQEHDFQQPSTSSKSIFPSTPRPSPRPILMKQQQPPTEEGGDAITDIEALFFLPQRLPHNHAFFRLPKLQPGVTPVQIDLQRAMTSERRRERPLFALRLARGLLAKEFLTQQEANMLARVVEVLVTECYHNQRAPIETRDVRRASDVLAARFMFFDIIVSGILVVQQDLFASPEWKAFVKLIPHSISGGPQSEEAENPRKSHYGGLARTLSRVLAILKEGQRPEDKVLYGLKYALFCKKEYFLRFRRASYDPWKLDCPDK